ncbi:GNAT family N-acetyltransferase [Actinoplanes teichomyceticus]|uniref:Putative acetyltransferase n=1 Tax=Actinoplanes teichomyceticus TaxID=1867 RepID=A0A561WKQ4_ACTTI|nr:GNAT family N-acetyltransferase [Actinoplanes teichomyceticus]TWG24444.1 putative acetyltransferase [Actinoplanes teichomyceticus]GIF12705.1 UPF0256 protein [Actinoplanes teichomyceticus]
MLRVGEVSADYVRFTRSALKLHYGIDLPETAVAAKAALARPGGFLTIGDPGVIGAAAIFPFDMTVAPGETLPVSGIGDVAVSPNHRRRGWLAALMREHLRSAAEHGDALTVLTASEAAIYGRFGYAPVTEAASWSLHTEGLELRSRPVTGAVELLDDPSAATAVPEAFSAYQRGAPGELARSARWWTTRWNDPVAVGAPADTFVALYRDGQGRPTGYATWSRGGPWTPYHGPGVVEVDEFVAAGPEAAYALLAFLRSLDLCREIVFRKRPVGEPLREHLADIRRLRMAERVDKLWARVADVPRVVRACTAGIDRVVTIAVHDPGTGSTGRYTLTPDGDRVACRPGAHAPDLTLSSADLTACLLGAVSIVELARRGRIDGGDRGALLAVARALAGQTTPHCSTGF